MLKFAGSEQRDEREVNLCRVLQRIEEHDAIIQSLSQKEDRDQYLCAITTMLGLRGHMYSEMIRIQMMLAVDDPEMKVIGLHFTVTVL